MMSGDALPRRRDSVSVDKADKITEASAVELDESALDGAQGGARLSLNPMKIDPARSRISTMTRKVSDPLLSGGLRIADDGSV